jgi:uncharacterized membrane protein YphA (DoxX/SURF4 family)
MTDQNNSKAMNIGLWVAQVLIAAMIFMAGFMKASQPIETLAEALPWAADIPLVLVRFIGISEVLAALGLLLPALLRIKPFLTVWAALGLVVVMVLAAGFHALSGEFSGIGLNVMIMVLAAFVAWGRSKKAPIQAK